MPSSLITTQFNNVTFSTDDNTSAVKNDLIKSFEKMKNLVTFFIAEDSWAVNILMSINY